MQKEFTNKEKMLLATKIENLKLEVSEANLKKTGRNNFQKYSYFELKDFMPFVRKAVLKHRLSTLFKVVENVAYLTVYDLDTGCYTKWAHQLPKVNETTINKQGIESEVLPTEQEKQKGALETYARRYLYLAFLELTDGDAIDNGDMTPKQSTTKKSKKYASPKQVHDQLHKELGDSYNKEEARKLLEEYLKTDYTTEAIKKMVITLIDKE